MKRRDLIRQKSKLAKTGGFRYVRYAKYACIATVVLFLVYVGGPSNLSGRSYKDLISKSPIVTIGFAIRTANLYVWYVPKHFLKNLVVPQRAGNMRINLLLMTTGQFIPMNFISAILVMLSLGKYLQWNTFSVKNALKETRKEKQLSVLIITTLVLILFISPVFGIYPSIHQLHSGSWWCRSRCFPICDNAYAAPVWESEWTDSLWYRNEMAEYCGRLL